MICHHKKCYVLNSCVFAKGEQNLSNIHYMVVLGVLLVNDEVEQYCCANTFTFIFLVSSCALLNTTQKLYCWSVSIVYLSPIQQIGGLRMVPINQTSFMQVPLGKLITVGFWYKTIQKRFLQRFDTIFGLKMIVKSGLGNFLLYIC